MAVTREVIVSITDDVSGKTGKPEEGYIEGYTFSIAGQYYQGDVGPETIARIEKAMAPFIKSFKETDPPKLSSGAGIQLTDEQKAWNKRVIKWAKTAPEVPEGDRPSRGWLASKVIKDLYVAVVKDDPYPEN